MDVGWFEDLGGYSAFRQAASAGPCGSAVQCSAGPDLLLLSADKILTGNHA